MRRLGPIVLEILVVLAVTSAIVWALEVSLRLENAGSLYLPGVAAIAIRRGTAAALVTTIGAFLTYNLLFIEPRFTLTVARPEELVTLVLLLFVGLVIGRLGGLQRDRAQLAARREREARALFAISRELATSHRLSSAIDAVLDRLRTEANLTRAWIGLGPTVTQERTLADTATGDPIEPAAAHVVLRRDRGEDSATWVRIRSSGPAGTPEHPSDRVRYRIALTADGQAIGSLWCERAGRDGAPELEETRLLAVTADQVSQAVQRDRLVAAAADVEIERRSDELRSALLDSVSHDLRTPLASIRAAAGNLADPAIQLEDDERRAAARSIDEEAARMNQLVDSLLDMSRIQSGALVADLEVTPLTQLIEPIVERLGAQRASELSVSIPDDLPTVMVDQTFLSQAVSNVLDNAVTHAPAGAAIRIGARAVGDAVEITVEDAGPGVAPEALPRLFDRFFRAPGAAPSSRRGVGLGLTVVRGLVEAMGGSVEAAPSELGGLAVTIRVRAAVADEASEA